MVKQCHSLSIYLLSILQAFVQHGTASGLMGTPNRVRLFFFPLIPGHRVFGLEGQDYEVAFAMAHRSCLGELRQSCD